MESVLIEGAEVIPAEVVKRAFTFEFMARATVYAETEEGARAKLFRERGYPISTAELKEVR